VAKPAVKKAAPVSKPVVHKPQPAPAAPVVTHVAQTTLNPQAAWPFPTATRP
jgi:hypothetical protein